MLANQAAALYPFGQRSQTREEGLEDKGSATEPEMRHLFGLRDDLRGWVLAAGSLGAALLGVGLLLTGDPFGLLYLAAGVAGYVFLHSRVFSLAIWSGVALGALAGAILGGSWSGLLVALVAAGLAVVAARRGTGRRTAVSAGTGSVDGAQTSVEPPEGSEPPLSLTKPAAVESRRTVIRSVGRIQVLHDGEDLSAALLQRPTLAFLWSFLLARLVLSEQPLLRNSLADEMSPGLPAQSQTKRLRDQLYNLQHDIPPLIGGMIEADRHQVGLRLNGADFDVLRLRDLSQSLTREAELLEPAMAEQAEALLKELARGEFLPGFEELENAVTEGRGAAGDTVRDARLQVAGWRAAVACAVADHRLARRQPELALQVLEPRLADAPQREDVGRRLISAYLQTGQTARAEQLRRELGNRGEV